jgi:hypothetical protein
VFRKVLVTGQEKKKKEKSNQTSLISDVKVYAHSPTLGIQFNCKKQTNKKTLLFYDHSL